MDTRARSKTADEQMLRSHEPLKLLPSPSIITTNTSSPSSSDAELPQLLANSHITATRPVASRSFTDPTSPSSSAPSSPVGNMKMTSLAFRPRNTSPYSRPQLRARANTSSLSAPPITRSHSSPVMETLSTSPFNRPASPSPLNSVPRRISPLRRPVEESYSGFGGLDIDQTISENSELNIITPRQISTSSSLLEDALSPVPHSPSSPFSTHSTFPRSARRRPASPLHTFQGSGLSGSLTQPSRLHTSTSSPALRSPTLSSPASGKYNESFPSSNYAASLSAFSATSSIPSTPTSFRSRSPSISSLETIPDSPDAEREAVEQTEKEMRDKAEHDAKMEKEVVRGRGRVREGRVGERKRWSVCGAERRADLDVIWED